MNLVRCGGGQGVGIVRAGQGDIRACGLINRINRDLSLELGLRRFRKPGRTPVPVHRKGLKFRQERVLPLGKICLQANSACQTVGSSPGVSWALRLKSASARRPYNTWLVGEDKMLVKGAATWPEIGLHSRNIRQWQCPAR